MLEKKKKCFTETHSMIKRAYGIPISLRDTEHTLQAAGKTAGLPKCLKSPDFYRARAIKGTNIQIIPRKQSQNKTTTDLNNCHCLKIRGILRMATAIFELFFKKISSP